MISTHTDEYKQNEISCNKPDTQPAPSPTYIMSQEDISADDINKIERLSISPKLLYVDALNYGTRFFEIGASHWSLNKAVNNVKKFVQAATNSGWQLKIFIDAAIKSGEAINKWLKRREAEIKKGTRHIPQGLSVLLGDAFRENGVEVLYSVEADNDDTLAAYANQDKAAILSGDRDFFRYKGLDCPLYKDFEIKGGYLHLSPLHPNHKIVSKRDLISPLPNIMVKDSSLVELISKKLYRRGAPSSLVKQLGNIHIACRSLRQALYARRDIKDPVVEVFPVWENGKVVWLEAEVLPDDRLDDLLDNPSEAVEMLFPKASLIKPDGVSAKDWNNHLYSITAVVYELCALGNRNGVSFLQMLLPATINFMKMRENKQDQRPHKDAKVAKVAKVIVPAYEASCIVCQSSIKLSEKEVEFFQNKGFSMPKRCKGCRNLKKQNNMKPSFSRGPVRNQIIEANK